ncbi:MAG: TetR/AcrR family transcriptional regulator [Pseudomonadota bacterium]
MSSDHTKAAILTAAETLWAERSFGEVTMRDIVAAAGVNLAAVNYHFGSKDELLADLFISRTTVLNRERFAELKAAEEAGAGQPSVEAILLALVSPPLRWCLSPDLQRSAAARFMTRASIETVPPIKKIVDREFRHLQRFATALRKALPCREEVDIYWGLHFALAMIRQTLTDSDRLRKLSGGLCDTSDTDDVIKRIVAVANAALTGGARAAGSVPARATGSRKS